ncbi:MAG: hypothetical protein ACOCX1_01330 [Fimbriimonadaceae bacterium]
MKPGPEEPSQPTVKPERRPKGWVIGAIIAVGATCLVIIVFGAILFPVFAQARLAANQEVSLNKLKDQSVALLQYALDNNDRFPAEAWMDGIGLYLSDESTLVSPRAEQEGLYGYAMYAPVAGTTTYAYRTPKLLVFDSSDFSRNAIGGTELLPEEPPYQSYPFALTNGATEAEDREQVLAYAELPVQEEGSAGP